MSRFLVYTTPAVGHTLPLVPGLLELQRRGHTVHVVAHPDLVDVLTEAGIDASPVDPSVIDVPITDYQASNDTERLRSGQVDLIQRGRFDGPDLERAIARFRPDAVMVDAIAYGAQTAAEKSGLPRAMLLPSVLPLPGRGIPAYGLGMKPATGPLGRARDAVLWKVVERMFGKAMLPGLNELRAGYGLAPLSSPLDSYASPDAVITMTGAPIEYDRTDLPAHVHVVGAQPWDPPTDRPAYLDEPGDPWVLVTCSTEYQGDENLALVAAQALAGEPVRVLLTLADAYDGTDLPDADNVHAERFVPHGQVLPECAAVICHGGMGIVSKAMAAGVPSVVVPFGRDQPEIARRVTEAGAGVSLKPKQLTPERLRAALADARALTPGAQRAAATMRGSGGAERFADAASTLVSGTADAEEEDRAVTA